MHITPHPTPLLNISCSWPWGLKCTHLSDLALHCYISLYMYHNKLTGQCIGAWCCVHVVSYPQDRLQGFYSLVICGVYYDI